LRIATEVFDDRIIQRTALVRRLLPPLTMVVVAILAFLVVASLMIPLVKLIEGLSR
jgi:type II secretory pathway component PulF